MQHGAPRSKPASVCLRWQVWYIDTNELEDVAENRCSALLIEWGFISLLFITVSKVNVKYCEGKEYSELASYSASFISLESRQLFGQVYLDCTSFA